KPRFNVVPIVCVSVAQPLLQYGKRRRQNKNRYSVRHQVSDLCSSLDVDIKNHVASVVQLFLDNMTSGAVPMSMNFGAFDEMSRLAHFQKLLYRNEEIIETVPFLSPQRSGRIRD